MSNGEYLTVDKSISKNVNVFCICVCVRIYTCLSVSREITSLSWWGGFHDSMTQRAVPVGVLLFEHCYGNCNYELKSTGPMGNFN